MRRRVRARPPSSHKARGPSDGPRLPHAPGGKRYLLEQRDTSIKRYVCYRVISTWGTGTTGAALRRLITSTTGKMSHIRRLRIQQLDCTLADLG